MTVENPDATYICINAKDAVVPVELEYQSVCIEDDIGEVMELV